MPSLRLRLTPSRLCLVTPVTQPDTYLSVFPTRLGRERATIAVEQPLQSPSGTEELLVLYGH